MNISSLKDFKQRLKDFEKRLTEKENDHQKYLENQQSAGLDDLGNARETLEDILRRTPEDHEDHKWDEEKGTLKADFASLLILLSQ